MNIRVIINALLIILILHIIILNIDFKVTIGKNINIDKNNYLENFQEKKDGNLRSIDEIKPDNISEINSLDFLNSDNDDFKKKLTKFIKEDTVQPENKFEKQNILSVSAANAYLNDNNVPNFESNVADISKFFKINYDNLNEEQLRSTSIEDLRKNHDESKKKVISASIKENDAINPFVRTSKENPDTWSYKNELPMNGGTIVNGILGFDSLESQFAVYNPNKLNLQAADSNNFDNIPHDDLRKPIVYEN
jgi:hypothetical protein